MICRSIIKTSYYRSISVAIDVTRYTKAIIMRKYIILHFFSSPTKEITFSAFNLLLCNKQLKQIFVMPKVRCSDRASRASAGAPKCASPRTSVHASSVATQSLPAMTGRRRQACAPVQASENLVATSQ